MKFRCGDDAAIAATAPRESASERPVALRVDFTELANHQIDTALPASRTTSVLEKDCPASTDNCFLELDNVPSEQAVANLAFILSDTFDWRSTTSHDAAGGPNRRGRSTCPQRALSRLGSHIRAVRSMRDTACHACHSGNVHLRKPSSPARRSSI